MIEVDLPEVEPASPSPPRCAADFREAHRPEEARCSDGSVSVLKDDQPRRSRIGSCRRRPVEGCDPAENDHIEIAQVRP